MHLPSSAFINFLLAIIYIISTPAFNALIALTAISISVSYVPPILFITIRKIRGQHPPYGPIKLGRYGLPINLLSLAYLIYAITWMPFPAILPVTAGNFNYSGPLLGAVIIGAPIDWVISGHKRFKVPVAPKLQMS